MLIEHLFELSTQGDADAIKAVPLDTHEQPATLDSVIVYQSAVAGTPTAVTLDLDITDGTTTKNAITAGALGTAAGTVRLEPDQSAQEDGDHIAPLEQSDYWRYTFDLNFTGGTTPTITGTVVVRWRV